LCLGGGGDSSSLDEDEDEDEGEGGSSLRFLEEEDFLDAFLFLDRLSSTEVGGKCAIYCLQQQKERGAISSPYSQVGNVGNKLGF